MAIPNTRSTFKEYCLRSLGKPVIEINVDPDQVEDRIDEALQYFSQYHYDGIERVYLKYQLTADDITRARSNDSGTTVTDIDTTTTATWYEQKNYIPVPSSIVSIVKVFPLTDKSALNMFDIRYQLRLNDLYDFSSTSVIHYEMTMQHLDFLDHILIGETAIRHNQHQNRLYLDADFQTDFVEGDHILIECYRKLDPNTYTDMWDDIFLKKYATQLIKMQWGANLSKFQGIQMLGGVALNGEQIYTQAQEQIEKLEEQIQLAYELPPMYQIG
tara:strand:+ start:901 stop:1716 length:816 start_codon:yes stop_codon:yes gene_type:complete